MIYLFKIIRKINIVIRRLYYSLICKNIDIGLRLNFRRNFTINCEGDGKVFIGSNVFFNNEVTINSHKSIKIGDNCIFGENVKIYDHNHVFSVLEVPIREQGFRCKEIVIGNNCWVGSNVVILPGSFIGDGSIIGAGCVVSGYIEKDSIVTSSCRELIITRRNMNGK